MTGSMRFSTRRLALSWSLGAAALASLCFAPGGASAQDADPAGSDAKYAPGALYVTAGRVLDGRGGVFAPGAVAIADGVVQAVGPADQVARPAMSRRIDGGPHSTIIPGLVIAHTQHLAAGGDDPASVAPDVKALDGFDFLADETRALSAGVTTVFLSPGSVRVVSGRSAVVKTAGASPERRTLRADAGLVASIGDAVNRPPAIIEPPDLPDATANPLLPHRSQLPVTRAGSLLLLRDLLGKGREGDETVKDVATGKSTLWLGAQTTGDLDAAIGLINESELRAVLMGAFGASERVDQLAELNLPVVLSWPDRPGRVSASGDPVAEKVRAAARGNAARLAAAGVRFALAPADEASLDEALFVCAGAVRAGLSQEQALASMTSAAAEILGVSDRVGSLEKGKDGDLILMSGLPTDPRSFVRTTVVDGEVVYERDRAEETAHGTVVVRAAEVHVGDGRVFSPGEVAFENGKIVEVGTSVGVPPGARFIDLGTGAVMPGLIDAFSHAGLVGDGGTLGGDLDTAVTTATAADFADPSFALLAGHGVTAVLSTPAGTGRVAGRASVLKTAGDDAKQRRVRADAGLVVRLSSERDLSAASKQLDGMLKRAKDYFTALAKYEKAKKEYDDWKKKQDADAAKKKKEAADKKAADEKKDAGKKEASKKEPAGDDKKKENEKKDDEKKKDSKSPSGESDDPADDPLFPSDTAPQDEKDKTDTKKAEDDKAPQERRSRRSRSGRAEKPAAKTAAKPATPEKKEPVKPATNESLEGYRDVLDKKVPVYVRSSTVEELREALKLLSGKWKLKVVVVGGEDVRRMTSELSKAGVGVIASPRVLVSDNGRPVNLLRELSISGLPASVGSDAYLGGSELMELLNYAVSRGLSPASAVRMATGGAAKLLGVSDRLGTLTPGRDADLILLSGSPFGAGSRIERIYVGGKEVDRAGD